MVNLIKKRDNIDAKELLSDYKCFQQDVKEIVLNLFLNSLIISSEKKSKL